MPVFEYAEKKVFETDNRVKAGFDAARLQRTLYESIVDSLFEEQMLGQKMTYAERKETNLKSPLIRERRDNFRAVLGQMPLAGDCRKMAEEQAQRVIETGKEFEGICNAWSTVWIWNAYQNADTIEDQPDKSLCKAFQKYYVTSCAINVLKEKSDASEPLADEKFMAKLKEFTRTFGLKIDDARSVSAEFPGKPAKSYGDQHRDAAAKITTALAGNPAQASSS